jgi:hypothetical protein
MAAAVADDGECRVNCSHLLAICSGSSLQYFPLEDGELQAEANNITNSTSVHITQAEGVVCTDTACSLYISSFEKFVNQFVGLLFSQKLHSFQSVCIKQCLSLSLSHTAYGYGFVMIVIISLLSLLGVVIVPLIRQNSRLLLVYKHLISLLIAMGVAALTTDALLHLIPNR